MGSIDSPTYPWYTSVTGSELQQGDILLACPVLGIPPEVLSNGNGNAAVSIDSQNVILLTQSCDLAIRDGGKCKVDEVLLATVFFKSELTDDPVFGKSAGWNNCRKGRYPRYHVLNQCSVEGCALDFMIVDFSRLYSHSVEIVQTVAADVNTRARLLSPYREHLSQAFARYFMRVGLPVDIPSF